MCLAVPAKIIEKLNDSEGLVDLGGVRYRANLTLVEGVAVGDYVIVHAGFAIQRLDEEDARQTLSLFLEMADLAAGEDDPGGVL